MGVTNNLDKMTIEEKIMAMEHLWDDLCRHVPDRLTQPLAVYSHLTRCVQQKAMEYYLEHTVIEELPVKMVGNK
jgi:hypothetical protein